MASYSEDTLTKGETILLKGKIALRKYWLNFLVGGLLLLPSIPMLVMGLMDPTTRAALGFSVAEFVTALLIVAPAIMRMLTNELVLTNKRVIAKVGIVSLDAVEIKLEKIESVVVKQSLFGKLLNYGTIVVTGTGATHAIIPAIAYPVIFKRQFNSALESLAA